MRVPFLIFLFSLFTCSALSAPRELLFTAARVSAAKAHIAADTAYAAAWATLQRQADALVRRPRIDQADIPALAWLITGERRYADAVRAALLTATRDSTWTNGEMMLRTPAWHSELTMAHRAFACANAYNAIRPTLSAADRRAISAALWRLAAAPLLADWTDPDTRIHCLNSMGHNWWASCVGMGGVLALALADDVPAALKATEGLDAAFAQWYAFAGDTLQRKSQTFDPAGGMYEGINYGGYALQEAMLYRLAEHNACPQRRQRDVPQLHHIADFFCHTCYPRTGELFTTNFGDSHLRTTGYNALLLLSALGLGSDAAAWYIGQVRQHQHREQYNLDTPMGLLYTPYSLRSTPYSLLPTPYALYPSLGWATMRSSWQPDATMIAIKSGATWNHAHADAGSFMLFHNGEQILGEAGRCWYAKPDYRNYYFLSEAHNVVLADGKGQPHSQQYYGASLRGTVGPMVGEGDIKYVLADATGPNADRFARYFRHLLWITGGGDLQSPGAKNITGGGDLQSPGAKTSCSPQPSVLLVIDDILTYEPATLTWLWHPGGETVRRGSSLVVTKGRAQATITPLFPEQLAPSAFQQDYPRALLAETREATGEDLQPAPPYYALTMPYKTERVKGVTAICLTGGGGFLAADASLGGKKAAAPGGAITRREGKDWLGVRITCGAHTTDVYINQLADGRLMHSNSWIEADGWQTDAYMLVVRDKKPAFIVYGSALRRDGKTLFAALQKRTQAVCGL